MHARILLALGLLTLGAAGASAQSYPSKPVRIIVPIAAGGATDVIARALGQQLSAAWKQQVVIENKAGAGNQIGAEYVARSPADGYTLMAAGYTFVVSTYFSSKAPYDPLKDFTPISGLGVINQALVVHPSLPAHNVRDLVALAKAKPGEVTYGTFGPGSPPHLNMALLERMADAKLNPVHYRGGGPALNDLIGGHIQALFINVGLMAQPWKAGQLRPLGVGSSKRLAEFPDLPTVAESGLPGFQAQVWFGLFGPAGLSRDIADKVNADAQRILGDREFRQKFLDSNFYQPLVGSPEQFGDYVRTDAEKWQRVIKEANIKVD